MKGSIASTKGSVRTTNVPNRKKGPLDHIYVNPNVTREAQRDLAAKLHSEISAEKDLDDLFRNRSHPSKASDRSEDSAKIFNDFCVQFIDSSKDTKDRVSDVLARASDRLRELEEAKAHLEEVERRTYRFEMNLPEQTSSIEDEMNRAIDEMKNKPRNELMDLLESNPKTTKKKTNKVRSAKV